MRVEIEQPSSKSSQVIYETLLNSDSFSSGNPYDIMRSITEYGINQSDNLINQSEDIDPSEDTLTDLLGNLDSFTEKLSTDPKTLDSLLDELLDQNDINQITFDSDHENIFELENTPTIDIMEAFKEDLTDEEIIKGLKGTDKKIGSNLQKTIKVYELYNSKTLLFKDEAQELSDLLIHKLISYWEIIIDFNTITDISDSFLRGVFDEICKYLSPTEIMEKITLINIKDELDIKVFKEIIPNAFKYWMSNSNIQNVDIEKLDLIRQLDPTSELILDSPEKLTARGIPFERINSRGLGNKREKKLRYPIWFVERVTEEVISKYDIDNKILGFIDSKIVINWKEVLNNCNLKDSSFYKYQINPEVYDDIFSFTEAIILDSCHHYLKDLKVEIDKLIEEIKDIKSKLPSKLITAGGVCFQNLYLDDKMVNELPPITKFRLRKLEELEFTLLDLEHKYIIKEDILRNIFEIISFSCYRTGLDKVKLVTYHYICRYLEELTIPFKQENNIYKVRGFVVPLEVFRYDLLNILCYDDTMKKFIFTMKELIMKWVSKYTFGSRLAQFYFDILMVTPDILTEQILRILALSIIKNKNPMTLRAIYSSYISLVHMIIDSSINYTDLDKKKYGNFGTIQRLSKNLDKHYDDRMLVPSAFKDSYPDSLLLRAWLYKNPKMLNENYHLMKRLHLYKFLEIDSLRIFATKPKDIGIYDWYWYYTNFVQFIEKDSDMVYKIKSKYLKSDKKNSQLKIIEIMCHDALYDKLKTTIIDPVCIGEILGVIAEDISMRTINRGYMDKDFNLIVKSNQDYLNYIHTSLMAIRDSI